MLEKGMPKTWKKLKNGTELGTKIHKNPYQNDVGSKYENLKKK